MRCLHGSTAKRGPVEVIEEVVLEYAVHNVFAHLRSADG